MSNALEVQTGWGKERTDSVVKDRHLFNVALLCNICPQEFFFFFF